MKCCVRAYGTGDSVPQKIEMFFIERIKYSKPAIVILILRNQMQSRAIYIVIENNQMHTELHASYEAAREAALEKYKEQLDEERENFLEWQGMSTMASQVDVAENTETGETSLYIEKEIFITIYRRYVNF